MEHKNIPNDGLHEPKDVVTASAGQVYVADGLGSGSWGVPKPAGIGTAQEGQVYTSNGAGGGDWSYPSGGWVVYEDTGSPEALTTVAQDISIDGLGSGTETDYAPKNAVTDLWSGSGITPVAPGDVYGIEFEYEVDSTDSAKLIFTLDGVVVERDAIVGVDKWTLPMHVFDSTAGPSYNVQAETDSGTTTITNRKVKIVQLYGG